MVYEKRRLLATKSNTFLEEKQFPFPSLVVNSGRGLHLYWIITPVEVNHPSVTFLYKSIQKN